eukprot:13867-Rhodomonas_salina.1
MEGERRYERREGGSGTTRRGGKRGTGGRERDSERVCAVPGSCHAVCSGQHTRAHSDVCQPECALRVGARRVKFSVLTASGRSRNLRGRIPRRDASSGRG